MSRPWGFVRRRGLALFDDDEPAAGGAGAAEPFCFVSFNIPELTFIQDPWRLPTRWEIRDALTTVVQQGGRVARPYTLSIRDPQAGSGDRPSHVEFDAAAGTVALNEAYMSVLDRVLATARELGVRVVLPFVDQWDWVGGIKSFARFRGFSNNLEDHFWTDPRIRDDFLSVVRMVVMRTNTVTGVRYSEDPTILAWETGNELDSPPTEWTCTVAQYIKALAPNHLVIDGRQGVDPGVLECPHVDVVSKHYYPAGDGKRFRECLREDLKVCAGRRPFFVGEFGFAMLSSTEDFLDDVVALGRAGQGVVGAMLWSLRFRASRRGGFFFHAEPWGFQTFWAYHWPGFETGARYDEPGMMALMRRYGARAQGLSESLPLPVPAPPLILGVSQLGEVTFRGSTGARTYELHRARDLSSGRWAVVQRGFHDCHLPEEGRVLDPSLMRTPPSHYFYRLVAVNEAGRSPPSPVVPLLLPSMDSGQASDPDAPAQPPSTLFYFRDSATGHLMQLGRREALLPAADMEDSGEEASDDEEDGGSEWVTRDLTILLKAPPVAPGTTVCPFGPWADGRVVYVGWNGHLLELDTITGALQDHTARFKARVADSPSVWPGQTLVLFRNAHNNHLCAVSFDAAAKSHRFRDYTHDARAPVVGAGGPLAVSRQEAVWVGDDQHVYRLSLATLALVDHSAATGIHALAPIRLMDRCKVFYASARSGNDGDGGDGGAPGRLVEESLQGGTQTKWKVTDHTRDHGAPLVAPWGGLFEVPFQSARVLYRGAGDGRCCELWYCGEAWRVARRDDEDGVGVGAGAESGAAAGDGAGGGAITMI